MRTSCVGNESLTEVEICSFPAQLLCQDLWQLPPAMSAKKRGRTRPGAAKAPGLVSRGAGRFLGGWGSFPRIGVGICREPRTDSFHDVPVGTAAAPSAQRPGQ